MLIYVIDDGVPVSHETDTFLLTISINPTRRQLRDVLRCVLTNQHPRYRHVIYSGLALSGTGCWLLSDGPFTCDDFVTALLANQGDQQAPVYVNTFGDGSWSQLAQAVPGVEVVLNPEGKFSSPPEGFIESLSRRIGVVESSALLGTTETIGTVSFARPTLYVFPGGDGGSSLFFGVKDLTVISDAGVGRRPAFWDFVRHFSHIDVLLGTHVGADNIFGLETFIERQCNSDLQMLPKLGHAIFNGSPDAVTTKLPESPTLLVHLREEVTKITKMLHDASIPPHICASPVGGKTIQKINLYQKINQGSVDLYVAHPVEDSHELKEFRRQCISHAPNFVSQSGVPLTNMVSIVAALVWKPYASTEKPVRIFFPGSAPLAKLYESLERLQGVPLFESLSGSGEEHTSRPTQIAKPATSKPSAKPTRAIQKPPPQLARAAKPSTSALARGQAARNVASPNGNREAASRKSALKTEPVGKLERVAKPSHSTHPVSADEKVKQHTSETAVSSKMQTSVKARPVDRELPADKVTSAELGETVHDVKAVEPGEQDLDEVGARDSVERDSLEASVCDDAMQVDSLCGDGEDHSNIHSDDEFDPIKAITVEKTSVSDYSETLHKDVDMHAEGVDIDDRISPRLDSSSAGNHERADLAGESDTLSSVRNMNTIATVDEASVPLNDNDPLCEAVHSRRADVVNAEATHDTQSGLDEAVDTEQCEMQQEPAQETKRDAAVRQAGECEFDGKHSSTLPSDLQQFPSVVTTESVPDEPSDELSDEREQEEIKEADIEATQEVDADRETCGIMPQGLPSPQKEAEWLETEHKDPVAEIFPHDDAANVGHLLKSVDEDGVLENSAVVESLSREDGGSEKIPQHDDVLMTSSSEDKDRDFVDDLERHECQQNTAGTTTVESDLPLDQKTEQNTDTTAVQPEVNAPDFSGKLLPDADEPQSEELAAEELQTVIQGESAPLSCDSESNNQLDHLPQNEELSNPMTNTDAENGDEVPLSPTEQQQMHSEKPLTAEEDSAPHSCDSESHVQWSDHLPQNEELTNADTEDRDEVPVSFTEQQQMESEKALTAEELQTVIQEESAPLSCDSESHFQRSDHLPQNDVSNPTMNTDAEDRDEVPNSHVEQQQMETSKQPLHGEHAVEPSSFSLTEPQEQLVDVLQHDTDIPDNVNIDADDVPISPVEQSAQEVTSQESQGTSFYYTEPQIQLTEDVDHTSDMELPMTATHSDAGTADDGQSEPCEQPHKESSSPDAVEEPFDPIQSWGSPMGLPAPLNSENKDGAKKRDSGAQGARHQTAQKTASSGKTGAERDLSGGRNGRTSAKPGKSAERPAAARKFAGSATEAHKVGSYL